MSASFGQLTQPNHFFRTQLLDSDARKACFLSRTSVLTMRVFLMVFQANRTGWDSCQICGNTEYQCNRAVGVWRMPGCLFLIVLVSLHARSIWGLWWCSYVLSRCGCVVCQANGRRGRAQKGRKSTAQHAISLGRRASLPGRVSCERKGQKMGPSSPLGLQLSALALVVELEKRLSNRGTAYIINGGLP